MEEQKYKRHVFQGPNWEQAFAYKWIEYVKVLKKIKNFIKNQKACAYTHPMPSINVYNTEVVFRAGWHFQYS